MARIPSLRIGVVVSTMMAVLGLLALAFPSIAQAALSRGPGVLVFSHGRLIDGSGADPIDDSAVVVSGGRIRYAGPRAGVTVPEGSTVVDVSGMTVLPGFINCHVHNAYTAGNLAAWAYAGVTTVRDESILDGYNWRAILKSRDSLHRPGYARIISACPSLAPLNGYCNLPILSPEDATRKVNDFIDAGIDVIKIALEDGIEGRTNLVLMTPAEYGAIIEAAHARGIPVSAHVTDAQFLQPMVDAGVDDVAHICYDTIPQETIEDMVRRNISFVPTLTVYAYYGGLRTAMANLKRFQDAGGRVAMGNDYADIMKQHGYEIGMPMRELTYMNLAGMTPMQIIVASTGSAASVCRRQDEIGTLGAGKAADLIVVRGNPIVDLNRLRDVCIVVKDGTVIRDDTGR